MTDDTKPFADTAERLRWHRDLEGLNQANYAAKAGLRRSQLNNVQEIGKVFWQGGKV